MTNFSLDCDLPTKDFMMTRIHTLMEVSGQSDTVEVKTNRFVGDTRTTDALRVGGDNSLESSSSSSSSTASPSCASTPSTARWATARPRAARTPSASPT